MDSFVYFIIHFPNFLRIWTFLNFLIFLFTVSGKCDNRVRLFTFLSTEGPFLAREILNPTRGEHVSPYPFRQANLYDATQPGNMIYCCNKENYITSKITICKLRYT